MKNSLLIDLDTDRAEEPIKITKPENLVANIEDSEAARKMVLDDMTTVCNALGTLIKVANDSNYFDAKKSAQMCIDYLTENFLTEEEK